MHTITYVSERSQCMKHVNPLIVYAVALGDAECECKMLRTPRCISLVFVMRDNLANYRISGATVDQVMKWTFKNAGTCP